MSEIGTPRRAAGARELRRSLRTPDSGIPGPGVRFALAGGTVMLVYLTTTSVLAEVLGLPFQAALAIGFSVGLMVHFTLQRFFVWTHHGEFALPLHRLTGSLGSRGSKTCRGCRSSVGFLLGVTQPSRSDAP